MRPDPVHPETPVRRILLAVLLAAVVVPAGTASAAAPACPGAGLVPNAANAKKVRVATLCLLKRERRMRGRGTLRYNAGLALAGRRHAGDMVRRRYFSHDSRSGEHFDDRIKRTGYLRGARSALVGENLGWGTGFLATPQAMVRQWMNSPGHRANILRRGFREIGIAVVTRTPGGTRGATYATAFGRRIGR